MGEYEFYSLILLLPGLLIVGGFAVFVTGILRRGKVAEFRHRERMAMIERGMVPPPEQGRSGDGVRGMSGARLTLGIVLCGLGMGLAMLIAFAGGAFAAGVGVGGAIVILGAAFIVSALVSREPERVDLPPVRVDSPPAPPAL